MYDFRYWVGGSDLATEGEFIWDHSGEKMADGFTKWHAMTNEPSGIPGEDCVILWKAEFYDTACDSAPKRYICEY